MDKKTMKTAIRKLREEEVVGDCYDSEYWEDGGVLSEDHVETNIDVVPPRPAQEGPTIVNMQPGFFGGVVPTVTQQREPDWEV